MRARERRAACTRGRVVDPRQLVRRHGRIPGTDERCDLAGPALTVLARSTSSSRRCTASPISVGWSPASPSPSRAAAPRAPAACRRCARRNSGSRSGRRARSRCRRAARRGGRRRRDLHELAQPRRGRRDLLACAFEERRAGPPRARATSRPSGARGLAAASGANRSIRSTTAAFPRSTSTRRRRIRAVELLAEPEPLEHPADRRSLVPLARAVDRARDDQPVHRAGHRDVVEAQPLGVLGLVLRLLDLLVRGRADARAGARVRRP